MEEKRQRIQEQFETTNKNLRDYIKGIVAQPGLAPLSGILGETESQGVFNVQDDLEHNLRAVAEHLIVTAAKETLENAPAKWSEKQIETVRAPMLAFGLIRDGDLTEGKSLRRAVLCIKEGGAPNDAADSEDSQTGTKEGGAVEEQARAKYFVPGGRDNLVECVRMFLIGAISKEVGFDAQKDPRSNLVCLTSASRACYFHSAVIRRDESGSKKCSLTWCPLARGDHVRRFRVEFELDSESLGEGARPQGFVYEGIMDHCPLRDRLRHIETDLGETLDMHVSDLGVSIVNYSMSTIWLAEKFRDKIVGPAVKYASGVISSEVLAQQRQKKLGGKQNPPVLKKNKPSKTEECFRAFEGCTSHDDAIAYILEMYYQLKKLQIDYIVACHIIGLIYHHHQRSRE